MDQLSFIRIEEQKLAFIRNKIEQWEGGYVHDPNDSGGDTAWNYLIKTYGNPLNISSMNCGLALLVLDGSINQGLRGTTKRLQKTINYMQKTQLTFNNLKHNVPLIEDGHYGNKTNIRFLYVIDALQKKGVSGSHINGRNNCHEYLMFLSYFSALRMKHYAKITADNPTFIGGWSARLMDITTQAILWDYDYLSSPSALAQDKLSIW